MKYCTKGKNKSKRRLVTIELSHYALLFYFIFANICYTTNYILVKTVK